MPSYPANSLQTNPDFVIENFSREQKGENEFRPVPRKSFQLDFTLPAFPKRSKVITTFANLPSAERALLDAAILAKLRRWLTLPKSYWDRWAPPDMDLLNGPTLN